jgi:hypothetical protein
LRLLQEQTCLNLPLGIGKVCLPVPSSVPNGTAAEACIGICTTWKIPTCIRANRLFRPNRHRRRPNSLSGPLTGRKPRFYGIDIGQAG